MNVYLDRKHGYAFVDIGKQHGIVIGSVEDVEGANDQEISQMVMSALSIHFYEQITSSKGMTLH